MFVEILSDLWQITKDTLNMLIQGGVFLCLIPLLCVIIRLIIRKERFEEKTAHKIALWNSVAVSVGLTILIFALNPSLGFDEILPAVGLISSVLAFPALLCYWINRTILTKRKNPVSSKIFGTNDCGEQSAKSPLEKSACLLDNKDAKGGE